MIWNESTLNSNWRGWSQRILELHVAPVLVGEGDEGLQRSASVHTFTSFWTRGLLQGCGADLSLFTPPAGSSESIAPHP